MLLHELAMLDPPEKGLSVLAALTDSREAGADFQDPGAIFKAMVLPVREGLAAPAGRVEETLRRQLIEVVASIGLDYAALLGPDRAEGTGQEVFDLLSDRTLAWAIAHAAFNESNPIVEGHSDPVAAEEVGRRVLARSSNSRLLFLTDVFGSERARQIDKGIGAEDSEAIQPSRAFVIGWELFDALYSAQVYGTVSDLESASPEVRRLAPVLAEVLTVWLLNPTWWTAGALPRRHTTGHSADGPGKARTRGRVARSMRVVGAIATGAYFYLGPDETWEWSCEHRA